MNFEIVKSYGTGTSVTVQGVFHGLGRVLTCSRAGHMQVFEPSSGLNEMASVRVDAEMTQVDALDNIVAMSDKNGVIRLWSAREDECH